MAIPEVFLDELVARSEISDVISNYVSLNRKGNNLWGLCPFHGEKTPSFSVAPDKQIYYCFGCGKGGGVISFIMEVEQLSFVDAVRLLAQRAGMTMPESSGQEGYRKRRDHLLELNKAAARYFHSQLFTPEGEEAAQYLFGKRKLSQATVRRFGLGFAPGGWDSLMNTMIEQGYTKQDLLDVGLVVDSKKGRIYDRFRGRVMFPIIDVRGDIIGFGGRVLDDTTPKYLNSPESTIYNKSRNLFGLNISKKSKMGQIILTEGYMDTIALHQAGFDCAVASLGTALTSEHAQLLMRYTKEVVIAFDGDGAGVSAAQRAIPLLEQVGAKVKVLRMVGAKDPDEYIKTFGADAFSKLIQDSENHIEYRIQQVKSKYNLEDDTQKIEFLGEVTQVLASLNSAVEREVYGTRCAGWVGISSDAMAQEVKKALERRIRQAKKKQERRDLTPVVQLQPKNRGMHYSNIKSARAEEGVVRLLLLDPTLCNQTASLEASQFSAPFLAKVYGIIQEKYKTGGRVNVAALSSVLESDEMSHLVKILEEPEDLTNSGQALTDYIAIIGTQWAIQANQGEIDPLMAAREKYREKKSYGGQTNE